MAIRQSNIANTILEKGSVSTVDTGATSIRVTSTDNTVIQTSPSSYSPVNKRIDVDLVANLNLPIAQPDTLGGIKPDNSTIQVDPVTGIATAIASSPIQLPLSIENGGTGQQEKNDALNALLPDQTGNEDKILSTNGTDTVWITQNTIENPLSIAKGGTGQTTQENALLALLPNILNNNGKVLGVVDGAVAWVDNGNSQVLELVSDYVGDLTVLHDWLLAQPNQESKLYFITKTIPNIVLNVPAVFADNNWNDYCAYINGDIQNKYDGIPNFKLVYAPNGRLYISTNDALNPISMYIPTDPTTSLNTQMFLTPPGATIVSKSYVTVAEAEDIAQTNFNTNIIPVKQQIALTVKSVAGVLPDANGNVPLTAANLNAPTNDQMTSAINNAVNSVSQVATNAQNTANATNTTLTENSTIAKANTALQYVEVIPHNGLEVSGKQGSRQTIKLLAATNTTLGGVIPDGDTIEVSSGGIINAVIDPNQNSAKFPLYDWIGVINCKTTSDSIIKAINPVLANSSPLYNTSLVFSVTKIDGAGQTSDPNKRTMYGMISYGAPNTKYGVASFVINDPTQGLQAIQDAQKINPVLIIVIQQIGQPVSTISVNVNSSDVVSFDSFALNITNSVITYNPVLFNTFQCKYNPVSNIFIFSIFNADVQFNPGFNTSPLNIASGIFRENIRVINRIDYGTATTGIPNSECEIWHLSYNPNDPSTYNNVLVKTGIINFTADFSGLLTTNFQEFINNNIVLVTFTPTANNPAGSVDYMPNRISNTIYPDTGPLIYDNKLFDYGTWTNSNNVYIKYNYSNVVAGSGIVEVSISLKRFPQIVSSFTQYLAICYNSNSEALGDYKVRLILDATDSQFSINLDNYFMEEILVNKLETKFNPITQKYELYVIWLLNCNNNNILIDSGLKSTNAITSQDIGAYLGKSDGSSNLGLGFDLYI